MPVAEINGIELVYEEQGEGPGLVFLHGAAGNHISWWQQLPAFRDRFRCISIDHRGFGRSTDPQGESAARFVDDIEALLDALGIERTALVSQSMGGRTALGFAVRHPQRVSALVLADTSASVDWPEFNERLEEQRAAIGLAQGPLVVAALGEKFQQRDRERTFLYRQIRRPQPARRCRDRAHRAARPGQVRRPRQLRRADAADRRQRRSADAARDHARAARGDSRLRVPRVRGLRTLGLL